MAALTKLSDLPKKKKKKTLDGILRGIGEEVDFKLHLREKFST